MALGRRDKSNSPTTTERGGKALAEKVEGRKRTVSGKHEADTARQFGGEVQRASGATERHKGDVKMRAFLCENKTRLPESRDAKSIRIQGEWLEKITNEAHSMGKDPMMDIQIPGIDDPLTEKRWVMIPASVFAAMLEESGRKG